jgi:hypothetical protein
MFGQPAPLFEAVCFAPVSRLLLLLKRQRMARIKMLSDDSQHVHLELTRRPMTAIAPGWN